MENKYRNILNIGSLIVNYLEAWKLYILVNKMVGVRLEKEIKEKKK